MHAHCVELKFCGYLFQFLGAPGVSITLGSEKEGEKPFESNQLQILMQDVCKNIFFYFFYFFKYPYLLNN
jgi:hypothetical protein